MISRAGRVAVAMETRLSTTDDAATAAADGGADDASIFNEAAGRFVHHLFSVAVDDDWPVWGRGWVSYPPW
ncbi:hypothetical protein GWI33_023231 [Rhynchophorus ferrugineus]|uniref:Uncharacterized protein n=1 Tax=Rhynchophorus ferrugineus TaxID=354439 RepID=A0A834HLK9_RHYFE|nr:hypothetical protein GWI33_023231 [Rhynchophorus ferrugineus]